SMYFLHSIGFIQSPLLAAVALSTTELGVVAPILRDKGMLETEFGKLLLSAAAMGEIGPLLVISALIIPAHSPVLHTLLMAIFVGILFLSAYLVTHVRSSKLVDLLVQTMQSSGQLPVRLCIALQALLVVLAGEFGFNVVIGAFAAGMVVSLASRGEGGLASNPDGKGEGGLLLRQKLDAIGYGFLVPFFFIAAGMRFDLASLWSDPLVPVQIIVFLGLLILIRGVPVLLYGKVLAEKDRLPFALYSATGLPLIVIITEIGVSSGLMTADRAAVLVSAGMISVLLFPLFAERIRERDS
ncbi:MAG: cation:proton antiporter, partial [Methylococcales bacterium]|nr:cation:proton antiporter [Methylococcales bacterium]